MKKEELIALQQFCAAHEVDLTFISKLSELGLVHIEQYEERQFVHRDTVYKIEKMVRMHRDLDINPEGIDVVFNLLERVDLLQQEMNTLKNRLRLYESDF